HERSSPDRRYLRAARPGVLEISTRPQRSVGRHQSADPTARAHPAPLPFHRGRLPHMSGAAADYEVAIVGCGPVGALAANLFGQAGLRTLVIEREGEPYPLPRAVHIDHEMMRLFQSVGLADRVRPLMREAQGHIHIGADGGVIRYLGSAGLPRRYGWANDYF